MKHIYNTLPLLILLAVHVYLLSQIRLLVSETFSYDSCCTLCVCVCERARALWCGVRTSVSRNIHTFIFLYINFEVRLFASLQNNFILILYLYVFLLQCQCELWMNGQLHASTVYSCTHHTNKDTGFHVRVNKMNNNKYYEKIDEICHGLFKYRF